MEIVKLLGNSRYILVFLLKKENKMWIAIIVGIAGIFIFDALLMVGATKQQKKFNERWGIKE